jgi:hypothetical protein
MAAGPVTLEPRNLQPLYAPSNLGAYLNGNAAAPGVIVV